MSRRILITGGAGMLGRTLARALAHEELRLVDREMDITDPAAVEAVFAAFSPQVVIHCAAMTAVDACETVREDAFRINATGSGIVATASARHGARMIAISTDYVFGGDLDRPYHEQDLPGPRTVYGASKLAGEDAVRAHCPDHVIARTAWLYGPGGPSFIHTMLKLGAQSGPALKVVDDQIGNPTSTDAVAGALRQLIERDVRGTLHLTCEGEATWFDLARAVFAACGRTRGLEPCTTAEYPRPAPRPANSRLEKRGLRLHGLAPMPDWRQALARFFRENPDG